MKYLAVLKPHEKEMLLKFPAYIAILAANWDGKIDEVEKRNAINFSHVKTYSSKDPLLKEFFKEADKVFVKNFEEIDNELPKGREERDKAINEALSKLEPILLKLEKKYAIKMHDSIYSFKDHVARVHPDFLESFFLPFSIKGLKD